MKLKLGAWVVSNMKVFLKLCLTETKLAIWPTKYASLMKFSNLICISVTIEKVSNNHVLSILYVIYIVFLILKKNEGSVKSNAFFDLTLI